MSRRSFLGRSIAPTSPAAAARQDGNSMRRPGCRSLDADREPPHVTIENLRGPTPSAHPLKNFSFNISTFTTPSTSFLPPIRLSLVRMANHAGRLDRRGGRRGRSLTDIAPPQHLLGLVQRVARRHAPAGAWIRPDTARHPGCCSSPPERCITGPDCMFSISDRRFYERSLQADRAAGSSDHRAWP